MMKYDNEKHVFNTHNPIIFALQKENGTSISVAERSTRKGYYSELVIFSHIVLLLGDHLLLQKKSNIYHLK